jgi:hypothetical protein
LPFWGAQPFAGLRCGPLNPHRQRNGPAPPAPLADQPHGQQTLLHYLIGLLAHLHTRSLGQGLPGGEVAHAPAIAREHLQQEIAQIFFACGVGWGDGGGGVGHGVGRDETSVANVVGVCLSHSLSSVSNADAGSKHERL